MFKFWRQRAKAKQSTTFTSHRNQLRAVLRVEQCEGRLVPAGSSVVYSNTFDLNGVASVAETVTQDAPGYNGQYLWDYKVTNESFSPGIATFAVPAEDASVVSNLGNDQGWLGSVGTFLSDQNLVSWSANGVQPLGIGATGDFSFTTPYTDLAVSNALVSDPTGTMTPGGLVAVPLQPPTEVPVVPGAPLPAILVNTAADKYTPDIGVTSLRAAIDWVNKQQLPATQFQVRFSTDLTNSTITLGALEQLPTITSNIFINGTGRNVTIQRDATQGDFRLIKGDDGSSIQLAGLTLQNGGGADFLGDGGAIYTSGNQLTVQNCTIQNNVAQNGGGIDDDAGNLSVQGGTITNNQATLGTGGGLNVLTGAVSIQNTTISSNTATNAGNGNGNGGGIALGSNVLVATITGATVSNNNADSDGGGVYVSGNIVENMSTQVTLTGCSIYQNSSIYGGGVAILKDVLNVINTQIYDNRATRNGGWNGGGVYIGAGVTTATFSGSKIYANTATNAGGGVYISTPDTGVTLNVQFVNTTVTGNAAATGGGGIGSGGATDGGTLNLSLDAATLIAYNSLSQPAAVGGGLYLYYGTVTFNGVTFQDNTANLAATGFYIVTGAGAVYGPGGAQLIGDTYSIQP
jgi:hypothetical protein